MSVLNYENLQYHPTQERIVEVLQIRTQNNNPLFFRIMTAYYFAVMSAHMRCSIKGWVGKGTIPCNVYAFNLSPSGTGKGHSSRIYEDDLLHGFREVLMNHTFPTMAEANLEVIAQNRSIRTGSLGIDKEREQVQKEYKLLGEPMFVFSQATEAAIKQMRQKLLMANTGGCNLQVDEIGVNLLETLEALNPYLELYDKGVVKDKLLKHTVDNARVEKLDGVTPANLMAFGSANKLLDGGKNEQILLEYLEMGMGRRCLFGFTNESTKVIDKSVDQVMKELFNPENDTALDTLALRFRDLAQMPNLNKVIHLPQDVARALVEYKLACETRGASMHETKAIQKTELDHRYFKALKLAGVYAFIDGSDTLTMDHLGYAVKLVEDSGASFEAMLQPEQNFVKLAKYLASCTSPVTIPDLINDLPSFRGGKQHQENLIQLAIAWGYKNHIIIRKLYQDGVMFLEADTIQETDLNKMIFSVSQTHITEGYKNMVMPFDQLHTLVTADGLNWTTHHLIGGDMKDPVSGIFRGHRVEQNCLNGFNLLVLDIDGTCSVSTAKMVLEKYKALYYTTKSHTEESHRFRVVMPMTHTIQLNADDYAEFYANVRNSFPIIIDEQCGQRSRKWASNNGAHIYTDGALFDPLPFIPKTQRAEEQRKRDHELRNLDTLERWVLNNIGEGNRNNMLIRYAFLLIDHAKTSDKTLTRDQIVEGVSKRVEELNAKIPRPLTNEELTHTILKSIKTKV